MGLRKRLENAPWLAISIACHVGALACLPLLFVKRTEQAIQPDKTTLVVSPRAAELTKIDLGERPVAPIANAAIPEPGAPMAEAPRLDPEVIESDHNETANDSEDHGTMKGQSVDSIGVGGGQTTQRDSSACVQVTESYQDHGRNPTTATAQDRLSTFAVDVDTASYTIARRKITEGYLPPPASVRLEEFVNFFRYDYPEPKGQEPFAVSLEAARSPVAPGKHILRVGLQGKRVRASERKPAHLTFLVDTSGSMARGDRLPLVQKALRLLVESLEPVDSVALCTYAGSVREVLPPTGIEARAQILEAIESLSAGGSTAMGTGLEVAYRLASRAFVKGAVNRVVICSDGDANVGPRTPGALFATIEGYVAQGITVSVAGFGLGNYKDDSMELIARKGNGNYYYIDDLKEAKRVFQTNLSGTLEVIAKDVKIQVELHESVKTYRLLGYENRAIADRDFRNDAVDAGEIGSGHSVTALYELVLDPAAKSGPLATVRIRHKAPDATKDEPARESLFPFPLEAIKGETALASNDFRFALAVAGFAEVLRGGPDWTLKRVCEVASGATTSGEREELILLATKAATLRAP